MQRHHAPGRQSGFTVIELSQVLATVLVSAHLAVSSFGDMINATRLTTASNAMLLALKTARAEAVKRDELITLRKHGDGWESGWVMFVDRNRNALLDDDEEVLLEQGALTSGFKARGNRPVATYVSYNGEGRSVYVNGGFKAGTLTICDRTATLAKGHARAVVISSTGRPRVSDDARDLKTCV
ncbi:MAG: GspH/FimT family pseudopilin [Thiotrichales bacterium]